MRSTKITSEHIKGGNSLSLIIRAGAGINTIDTDTASDYGIYVANCPGPNAIAVAELALGHLINLDEKISDNVIALRKGQWKKNIPPKECPWSVWKNHCCHWYRILWTRVRLTRKALGMKVKAWSRSLSPSKAEQLGTITDKPTRRLSWRRCTERSSGILMHTEGIIGEAKLEALNPGAYVINTSRGGIIDEAALAQAIERRNLLAGLDVFVGEPSSDGPFQSQTTQNSAVYGTHHIGASTEQASDAVGAAVVDIIKVWQQEGYVKNCVNLAEKSPADHLISIRHVDKVGVLAFILEAIREHNHNIQEMENIIFKGGRAARTNPNCWKNPLKKCFQK